MATSKQTIRRQMRERRVALAAAVVREAGHAVALRIAELAEFAAADGLLAYAAAGNEVPTEELIELARAAGKTVFLPRLTDGGMCSVAYRRGDALHTGALGIREPDGAPSADIGRHPLIVLPLLAFDRFGTRLGRGAGHYDRASASWPSGAVRVGLAYAFQECARLPRDPWDAPLDLVVSEAGLVRCALAAPQRGPDDETTERAPRTAEDAARTHSPKTLRRDPNGRGGEFSRWEG